MSEWKRSRKSTGETAAPSMYSCAAVDGESVARRSARRRSLRRRASLPPLLPLLAWPLVAAMGLYSSGTCVLLPPPTLPASLSSSPGQIHAAVALPSRLDAEGSALFPVPTNSVLALLPWLAALPVDDASPECCCCCCMARFRSISWRMRARRPLPVGVAVPLPVGATGGCAGRGLVVTVGVAVLVRRGRSAKTGVMTGRVWDALCVDGTHHVFLEP